MTTADRLVPYPVAAPPRWPHLEIEARPSPNHGARPAGITINTIVLHADQSAKVEATLDWCRQSRADLLLLWQKTDPKKRPAKPWGPVSYHDVVSRTGRLFELVDPLRRAYHAGASRFLGVEGCNDYALGLCLSNRNDGKEAYPEIQLHHAAARSALWMRRFPAITLARITTHAIVATPVGRKTDPAPPAFNLDAFRDRVAALLPLVPA